jgi:hypothetical protein
MRSSSRKKIGILLIALALIFLVAIIALFLRPEEGFLPGLKDSPKEESLSAEEKFYLEREKEKEASVPVYSFDEDEERRREWNEDDFKQAARSFAERFGSYSSQSDFSNIEDLSLSMSSRMRSWARDYIFELRSNRDYSEDFYGITTRALIEPKIKNFDLEGAIVELSVSTQREEISALGVADSYSQEIDIRFIKERGEWLVDSALWQ